MFRNHTVGVILPAYNEADRVGKVIEAMPEYVDRVYAIDDASTDDTWGAICAYTTSREAILGPAPEDGDPSEVIAADGSGHGDLDVVPVRHAINRGAGGTLKTGYGLAERDGMDITVTIDADGQMDPEEMDALIAPIVEGRADYAKGNRLAGDGSSDGMPPFRLLGNWMLTLLTKPASGYWRIRDPQNGYTAISLEALSAVDMAAVPDDHDYPNDLLARLNADGVRVADVPMDAIYGDERSTIAFSSFAPRTAKTILRSFIWRIRREGQDGKAHLPVLYVLGMLGFALGLLSIGQTAWRAVQPVAAKVSRTWPGAALLFLFGIVASLIALLVDTDDEPTVVRE
ncbi:glycosyltransferase family 2 protein [Halorientalis salina]|uniref:glycosyltransferase family 2 protein n=1 Tax=Halorientalis salina TaxID=2932266 RepID=UPI0010AD9592|nr:glycosyltransferase family 2 protein [Halorientalis salina]